MDNFSHHHLLSLKITLEQGKNLKTHYRTTLPALSLNLELPALHLNFEPIISPPTMFTSATFHSVKT